MGTTALCHDGPDVPERRHGDVRVAGRVAPRSDPGGGRPGSGDTRAMIDPVGAVAVVLPDDVDIAVGGHGDRRLDRKDDPFGQCFLRTPAGSVPMGVVDLLVGRLDIGLALLPDNVDGTVRVGGQSRVPRPIAQVVAQADDRRPGARLEAAVEDRVLSIPVDPGDMDPPGAIDDDAGLTGIGGGRELDGDTPVDPVPGSVEDLGAHVLHELLRPDDVDHSIRAGRDGRAGQLPHRELTDADLLLPVGGVGGTGKGSEKGQEQEGSGVRETSVPEDACEG